MYILFLEFSAAIVCHRGAILKVGELVICPKIVVYFRWTLDLHRRRHESSRQVAGARFAGSLEPLAGLSQLQTLYFRYTKFTGQSISKICSEATDARSAWSICRFTWTVSGAQPITRARSQEHGVYWSVSFRICSGTTHGDFHSLSVSDRHTRANQWLGWVEAA